MKTTCLLFAAVFLTGLVAGCGKPDRPPSKTAAPAENPPIKEDGSVVLPVDYSELGWSDDLFTYKDQPFTGVAVENHPNGKPSKRYEIRDGKYDGVTREWHANSERKSMTHFVKGQRHGPNTYWDEDGKVIKHQTYDHDVVVESTDPSEVKK